MKRKKKMLLSALCAGILLTTGWLARAEIRGFFLSCALVYREVPDGLSDDQLANYHDFLESTICGQQVMHPDE